MEEKKARVYGLDETARKLGYSRRQVQRLVSKGKLRPLDPGEIEKKIFNGYPDAYLFIYNHTVFDALVIDLLVYDRQENNIPYPWEKKR